MDKIIDESMVGYKQLIGSGIPPHLWLVASRQVSQINYHNQTAFLSFALLKQ